MGQLEGQVAVVTAGTRSIGRAIAEAFLAEGAFVVVNGRSADKGKAAVEEMATAGAGAGDRVHFIQGDAGSQKDAENVINRAVEHYGRLDIAVLNAGGVKNPAPVASITDEEWNYEININLNSTFWGMRAALQHMLPQEAGRIITVSSRKGKTGAPGLPGYVAAKHGVIGLTKACAHEVGAQGITVNSICPGFVITDLYYETVNKTSAAMGLSNPDDLASLLVKDSAIQRPVTAQEVAAAAVFLASPAAAGVTGTTINVDGGSVPF
jgi:NAD(P)-dependent dehydrogenase (short-subunit alcohol dehydrogenase family)